MKFHANGSYNNVVVCTHRPTLLLTPLRARYFLIPHVYLNSNPHSAMHILQAV